MNKSIPRLELGDLRPDLAEMLGPRVKRLGYLGEFFRCAGHQPAALIAFQTFTESSKGGLDSRLVELIALTVAAINGNAYESHQHQRLSVRSGFGRDWVAEVEKLDPVNSALASDDERVIQTFVIAALRDFGRGVANEFEAVVAAIGPQASVAVLMIVGRYLVHGLFVNTLELQPPVPSIWQDGFGA